MRRKIFVTSLPSMQDGSYSYCEFSRTFEEYEIQRVMRAYENSITVNVHCCDEGEWTQDRINAEQFSEFCQVTDNAEDIRVQGPISIPIWGPR